MSMNDFFYHDILKRTSDIFDFYKFMVKKPIPYSVDCQLCGEKNVGGRVNVVGNEIDLFFNTGTVISLLEIIERINNATMSSSLNSVLNVKPPNKLLKAEFIIPQNGRIITYGTDDVIITKSNIEMTFINRFIICHELAHALSGHFFLLKKNTNNNFCGMDMAGEYSKYAERFQGDKLTDLDIKTIEMDADAFAVTNAFYNLIYLYNNFETQVQNHELLIKQEIFELWGFSIAILFKWVEENIRNDYSHPSSSYRAINSFIIMNNLLNSSAIEGKDRTEALDALTRGFFSADELYSEKMKTERWFSEKAFNIQIAQYMKEKEIYDSTWSNKVMKLLKQYSIVPLYGDE